MFDEFKDMKILAVDETAPRFLVTPYGSQYLNSLTIYEISEEHQIFSSQPMETKKVMTKVQNDSSGQMESLYTRLTNLK